jgi:hypothetical protein
MRPRHSRESIIPFLAPAVHAAVAHAMFTRVALAIGIDPDSFTSEDALSVLELVARERGSFGIAGRVAMIRVMLLWQAG